MKLINYIKNNYILISLRLTIFGLKIKILQYALYVFKHFYNEYFKENQLVIIFIAFLSALIFFRKEVKLLKESIIILLDKIEIEVEHDENKKYFFFEPK